MNASDIVKRKQNGTLYTAYTTNNLRLSDPNTRAMVYSTTDGKWIPGYDCNGCNDFINYELQQDVNSGVYVCGTKTVSNVTFTTAPVICPNVNFYQGTNYTATCK